MLVKKLFLYFLLGFIGLYFIYAAVVPIITITSPQNDSIKDNDYVWLNVTNNKNSSCRYSLWDCDVDSCSKSGYIDMSIRPPVKSGVVSGESFKIAASGNDLNILEPLSDVKDVLDSSSLNALASWSVTNDKGTYVYDQYLTLGNATVVFDVSEEADITEDPALYLRIKSDTNTNNIADGTEAFRYKLSFPTALKSDIDSSRDLDDVDNKKVVILGKEYNIINTEFTTAGKLTLEMMGGDTRDTMEEGETKTYTINGKSYEVTVTTITDTSPFKVVFLINTETTDALQAGQIYTLDDNTSIGVKEILPNEAGDVTADVVEFYLGAQKLKLVDSNSSRDNADGTLTIDSNEIGNGAADLVWSNTTTELSLSAIQIAWQLNNSHYVPIDGKLTEHLAYQDDIDFVNAFNLDIWFTGITQGVKDTVEIIPEGNSNLLLKMNNRGGESINEEIFYTDGIEIYLGKNSSSQLHVNENDFIKEGEFFITEANKYSHILHLDKIDMDSNILYIRDMGSGTVDNVSIFGGSATLYKDGYALTFSNIQSGGVNLTGIAYGSDTKADLWTQYEHKITLYNNYTEIVEAPDVTRDDSATKKSNITIKNSIVSSKITPSTLTTNSKIADMEDNSIKDPGTALESNGNMKHGMTKWGALIEQDTSGDQDSIKLSLPEIETTANVYIKANYRTKDYGVSHYSLIPNLENTSNNWYELHVLCTDTENNENEAVTTFYVNPSYGEDTTPPKITILSPKNNTTIIGYSTWLNVTTDQ